MKRFLFLLLFFSFTANICCGQARPDEIVISYASFNKSLKVVLKDLATISKVNLVYSESRIPADKLVTINANNEKLGNILSVILDDYDITYQIVGDQLVLVKNIKKQNEESITIYGYVKDKSSGEILIGANVFLHDRSKGTVSNEYGFYSFKVSKQTQRLHYSYLGYKSEIIELSIFKDTLINIKLQPDGYLNEIVIMGDLLEEEHETTASQQNLHIDKILSSNHLVGEADLFRYLSNQAGINTAADGIGGLNVRGGSADQNLVLLDGVPVYNTGHALGIFSIFNSNSIKSASLYKGSIPARYAGRLSSVIDVHTKDGNFNKFSGDFSLSTIALKGTLEGPIVKEKSSYTISFRRTFVDVWIKQLTKYQNNDKERQGFSNYYFNDFNAKLNFKIGQKNRLLLSTFHSNDAFSSMTKEKDEAALRDENDKRINWGNQLYALRFNSQINKSFFSRFTLYNTGYSFNSYRNNLFENITGMDTSVFFDAYLFRSQISETGLRQEFDWLPTNTHTIKFGAGLQKRSFSPKVTSVNETNFEPKIKNINFETLQNYAKDINIKGDELNAFVEDDIDFGDGVRINAGINYSMIFADKNSRYSSLQPRFALLANSDNLHFKIGVTRMQQYLHLLTNNGLGLPTDVWVPTNSNLPPQKSWIFNTSFGYKLNNGFKFGTEVYYKKFDDISSFKEGGGLDISEGIDWQSNIPIGNGYAYGFETFVEKVLGSTLFAVNYTYSVSDRTYPDLNNGIKFPFSLNRSHNFKVSFTHRLSQFSEFLLNWSYSTGNYYSKPENISIDNDGRPTVVYLTKNNALFPAFHRLDIGFGFYNSFKWGKAKFFLGLYNAYNRNNPFYTELVRNNQNQALYEFKQYSLLPILPTISYSVSF